MFWSLTIHYRYVLKPDNSLPVCSEAWQFIIGMFWSLTIHYRYVLKPDNSLPVCSEAWQFITGMFWSLTIHYRYVLKPDNSLFPGMFWSLTIHYRFQKSRPFSSYPEPDQSRLGLSNWCLQIMYCIILNLQTWAINTLRTRSFKLFKRPFPGFLTISTL